MINQPIFFRRFLSALLILCLAPSSSFALRATGAEESASTQKLLTTRLQSAAGLEETAAQQTSGMSMVMRKFLDGRPHAIWYTRYEGDNESVEYANPEFARAFGMTVDDVLARKKYEAINPPGAPIQQYKDEDKAAMDQGIFMARGQDPAITVVKIKFDEGGVLGMFVPAASDLPVSLDSLEPALIETLRVVWTETGEIGSRLVQSTPPAAGQEESGLAKRVRAFIADYYSFPESDIKPETLLSTLHTDSLDLVGLILDLEDEFGLGIISDEESDRWKTVQDVIEFVEQVSIQEKGVRLEQGGILRDPTEWLKGLYLIETIAPGPYGQIRLAGIQQDGSSTGSTAVVGRNQILPNARYYEPGPTLAAGQEEKVRVMSLEELIATQDANAIELARQVEIRGDKGVALLPKEALDREVAVPQSRTIVVYTHTDVTPGVVAVLPIDWQTGGGILHPLDMNVLSIANKQLELAAKQEEAGKTTVVIGLDRETYTDQAGYLKLKLVRGLKLLLDPKTQGQLKFQRTELRAFFSHLQELAGYIVDLSSGSIRVVTIQGTEYYALDIAA